MRSGDKRQNIGSFLAAGERSSLAVTKTRRILYGKLGTVYLPSSSSAQGMKVLGK